MMSNQTLYLVQSQTNQTESALSKLDQIYSPTDAVVLMGDAVLFWKSDFLSRKTVYILENDAEILVEPLSANIRIISYTEFADLVLNFNRSISFK